MRLAALSAFCLIHRRFAADPRSYAGAEACRPCHAANFTSQSNTSHARALAPSSPPQPGDWAFGAGLQAITFVTRIDRESYREDGLSWYRSLNGYAITPGQHDEKGVVFRTFDPGARILTCFACHSTGPLSIGKDEEVIPHELGVRCEVCHGPARGARQRSRPQSPAHSRATDRRWHESLLRPVPPHRFRNRAKRLTDLRDPRNARDQTLRLAASACFLRSNGRLNCLTLPRPAPGTGSRMPRRMTRAARPATPTRRIGSRWPGKPAYRATCRAYRMARYLTFANHRIAVYAPANPLVPVSARPRQ